MANAQPAAPSVEIHRLVGDGGIPNNPDRPLLVYRAALQANGADLAAAFEQLFASHGWGGGWRNGVYGYHHFHATAHEVLGIARGHATVRFGGPSGVAVTVHAGDVVVVPAGVAHKNEGASADLLVIGAYPDGTEPDMRRPDQSGKTEELTARVAQVPIPRADPVMGATGPLIERWRR